MTQSIASTGRVVIVGGGIAGLAASVRLVQAGLPVTVFESSELGSAASTRNQGWLHSGALFASESPEYAQTCYASLEQTLRFCPDCLEPDLPAMACLFSRPDVLVQPWTAAWNAAGIPFQPMDVEQVAAELPDLDRARVQHAFRLPDRAFRPDVLLAQLAATARNAGVEIRTGTHVRCLHRGDQQIVSVNTSAGDEVASQLVILAGGASGLDLCLEFLRPRAGGQNEVELTPLRTRLVALEPEVGRLPFCVPDAGGFNHIPHLPSSVFGSGHWARASTLESQQDAQEQERVCARIREFFPGRTLIEAELHSWSGTLIQPLRADQIQVGGALWPAVIDHARHAPGITNLISIFPGRATLWPNLAEETRQLVFAKLDAPTVGVAHPPWLKGI